MCSARHQERVVELAQALIRQKSLSGTQDPGAMNLVKDFLDRLGFDIFELPFEGNGGTYAVSNLYARLGNGPPNLCFAGHVDVVPPGEGWSFDPFAGIVHDEQLIGRGAVDMKSSIAAFLVAVENVCHQHSFSKGSISFLITGDEELEAVNGTCRVVDWLKQKGESIDWCLVGEPTSRDVLLDEIKVGRRGSLSAEIKISGTQGHVAYPDNFKNPLDMLLDLAARIRKPLDSGSEFFDPSNLVITSVQGSGLSRNVTPAVATLVFNIRFNDLHTNDSLRQWIENECAEIRHPVELTYYGTSNAFMTDHADSIRLAQMTSQDLFGRSPKCTTGGGTSDARFIKDICPTLEIGPRFSQAHKIDESIPISDLVNLSIYYQKLVESCLQQWQ